MRQLSKDKTIVNPLAIQIHDNWSIAPQSLRINEQLITMLFKAIEVRDVLQDIVNTEIVIAGGFARDIYFGVHPKDIDIIIPKADLTSNALLTSSDKINELSLVLSIADGYCSDKRVDYVLKAKENNIDVIVWKGYTADTVVDGFDCNLNQFVATIELTADYKLKIVSRFLGKDHPIYGLKEIEGSIATYKRRAKMKSKWYAMRPYFDMRGNPEEVEVVIDLIGGDYD